MKRFEFRLERVLQYLRRRELVQSGVLASCERELQVRLRARDYQLSKQEEMQKLIRDSHMRMEREELMRSYAHSDYLARLIAGLTAEAEALAARRDEERAILHEMTKRRRVVEELRGRKFAVHEAELERAERAMLDDANARRGLTPYSSAEIIR